MHLMRWCPADGRNQAGVSVITTMWPEGDVFSDSIPERARSFLKQAVESLHAPSGAQVLAASAVDSMLKARGYTDAALKGRDTKTLSCLPELKRLRPIYLITPEMAEWAHEVRLDANDQRHADETSAPDAGRSGEDHRVRQGSCGVPVRLASDGHPRSREAVKTYSPIGREREHIRADARVRRSSQSLLL